MDMNLRLDHLRVDHVGDDRLVLAGQILVQERDERSRLILSPDAFLTAT